MALIAALNPMPSVGVGLGGFAYSLLLSSGFCQLFALHRVPGVPPGRIRGLWGSAVGAEPSAACGGFSEAEASLVREMRQLLPWRAAHLRTQA